MECQPKNPEFRIKTENFHPCIDFLLSNQENFIKHKLRPQTGGK